MTSPEVQHRPLGSTGLEVSELALGTVELGMRYGFRESRHYQPPETEDAIRLLRTAFDRGINLFDTAPTYGRAEELVGLAFAGMGRRPLVATKVSIPVDGNLAAVTETIENSLRLLQTETIDVLQIHNTSLSVLGRDDLFAWLERLRGEGKFRFLGASVDDEESAWAAISKDGVAMVQIAFNLLNQSMRRRVFPGARERRRGILIRSAFLRGVLTEQLDSIPARLDPLRAAGREAWEILRTDAASLSEAALRYCLSFPAASSVIVGVRSIAELEANLAAARKGPLPAAAVERAAAVAIEDEQLVTPSNWQDLI